MENKNLNITQQMILKRLCQIVDMEYRQIEDYLTVNDELTKKQYIMAGVKALCLAYETEKQLKKEGYLVDKYQIVKTTVRCAMLKLSQEA